MAWHSPTPNPTPTLHPGAAVGTPNRKEKVRSRERLVTPAKQTLEDE